MNEADLFAAYRNIPRRDPDDDPGPPVPPGSHRCAHGTCPVLIGDDQPRALCMFHTRKATERLARP